MPGSIVPLVSAESFTRSVPPSRIGGSAPEAEDAHHATAATAMRYPMLRRWGFERVYVLPLTADSRRPDACIATSAELRPS